MALQQKLKEWTWTITCLYMITITGFLILSFTVEFIRWGTQITWTLTQHYFWDYLLINYLAVTAGYIAVVLGFFKLNSTKKRKIIIKC